MREDEDQFGRYVPLLRRIIILVAVIIAIPVILWTITVSVHTYFGPPKIPTFHPTATASTAGPAVNADSSAKPAGATQDGASASSAPAGTATTDGRDMSGAAKGALLADRQPDSDANGVPGAPKIADLAIRAPMNGNMAPDLPAGAIAGQQQAATDATVDDLPAAAPLAGPIPLPRHRPRVFAMAQVAVPLPRPRPETAASASPDPSTPLGWIRNMFQPQQQTQEQ